MKNTDCLSLLRLLPPGISPPLIIECISLALPMWLMYSVKSSGNSTLSCNAESTRLPPECPWIALNYRKCLEELEFNQYWNLFLGLLPFARRVIQSLTGHCEVPSNFSLNSSMISSPGFPENLLGSFSLAISEILDSNISLQFVTMSLLIVHSLSVQPKYTWSRDEVGSPRSTSFIRIFQVGFMFFVLLAILISSTYIDKNSPLARLTD